MSEQKTYCPFFFDDKDGGTFSCFRDKCALWVNDPRRRTYCAFTSIAYSLMEVSHYIDDIQRELAYIVKRD
jgi:hypothetical protein